jgi:hypothetical protein
VNITSAPVTQKMENKMSLLDNRLRQSILLADIQINIAIISTIGYIAANLWLCHGHSKALQSFAKLDCLIIDDWGLEPLNAAHRNDMMEIMDVTSH